MRREEERIDQDETRRKMEIDNGQQSDGKIKRLIYFLL